MTRELSLFAVPPDAEPRVVISASRRTDLPAFYTRWLTDRVREGAVDVELPFRAGVTKRVDLRPERVAWFVFWSRNYRPWLRARDAFADYRVAFHFTITPGHLVLEPDVPSVDEAIRQVEELARTYGGDRVFWRYDPLVWWRDGDVLRSTHKPEVFERLARELGGFGVKRCITSIAAPYAKARSRFKRSGFTLVEPDASEIARVAGEIQGVAAAHGIALSACCTPALVSTGIPEAHCIDGALLSALAGEPVDWTSAATREGCGCTRSTDIGSYRQTCGYDCLYCYASPSLRRFGKAGAGAEGRG